MEFGLTFPSYWEWNNHPNWRTPFFRGVGQPPTSHGWTMYDRSLVLLGICYAASLSGETALISVVYRYTIISDVHTHTHTNIIYIYVYIYISRSTATPTKSERTNIPLKVILAADLFNFSCLNHPKPPRFAIEISWNRQRIPVTPAQNPCKSGAKQPPCPVSSGRGSHVMGPS